jgi:GH24 family phage-related lysozyme (muramidase)
VTKGDITLKTFEGNMFLTLTDGRLEQSAKQGVFIHATDGPIHVKAQESVFMEADVDVNVRTDLGNMNLTSASQFNLRSNNSSMLIFASQGVFIGEQTTINSGSAAAAAQAAEADSAFEGTGAPEARPAQGPVVREHPVQAFVPAGRGDLVGSAVPRVNSVITSVGSHVPAGETTNNRYQSGPGYSNTDTVIADELCSLQYKVGQVEFNQQVPLSVWGYVKGEDPGRPRRFIGEGYEEDGAPRYRAEDIPNGIMKPATEYTSDYEGISEVAFNKIKEFETLTGPWPSDRRMQPFHNACATPSGEDASVPPSGPAGWVGYGHKLTEQELQQGLLTIEGNQLSFDSLTEEWFVKLLKQDVTPIVTEVKSAMGGNLVTQQQLDALVDFAWNVGVQKFKDSDIVKLINDKKYDQVPNEIIKWSTACGAIRAPLLSRRLYNCYTWSGTQRTDSPVVLGPATADSSRSSRNIQTSQGVEIAYNELRRLGYSPAAAAGIIGNLWAESTMNPNAYNRGEDARGLAQWRFDRVVDVDGYLSRTYGTTLPRGPGGGGANVASVIQQVNGVHYEMTGGRDRGARNAGNLLRNNGGLTPAQASDIFNRYFERSASSMNLNSPNNQWRRNDSQAVFERFQGR